MSVIFDQLRISDDGKRMYLNAHVNKADYFKDIYLDSIVIMTSDKVSETHPGTPTQDYIYINRIEGNEKEINLVLDVSSFNEAYIKEKGVMEFPKGDLHDTLFFVYVKTKLGEGGTLDASSLPCAFDEMTNLGVVFDETVLYQRVMDYTKDLVSDCCMPQGFIDFILLWEAFKASIETEHYVSAIKFYNMLFGSMGTHKLTSKGCGCHG